MRIYYASQPEWRYLHTCPECGCHNVSSVALMPWYPFEAKKVCSLCGVSYPEIEEPEGLRRRSKERHLTASEWEIDRAIRRASRPQQEWVRLPKNLPPLPPSGGGLSKPSIPPVANRRGGERHLHFDRAENGGHRRFAAREVRRAWGWVRFLFPQGRKRNLPA
jgi:hypothetical protein